jgi:hypothetical protein
MEETNGERIFATEDVQQHLYVIEMRVPAMYWSGIVLYLGKLLGYSKWTTVALNLSEQLVANFKANTQKQQVMVIPMNKLQASEVERFCDRELPGAVSLYTLDGYYKARLGKGFEEVYAELYDEEEEE